MQGVILKTVLHGTKPYHSKTVNLELLQNGSSWTVAVIHCDKEDIDVVYHGGGEEDAKKWFFLCMKNHLDDSYCYKRNPEIDQFAFKMFQKMTEDHLLGFLSGMGYNVNGNWQSKILLKGNDQEINEVLLCLSKNLFNRTPSL